MMTSFEEYMAFVDRVRHPKSTEELSRTYQDWAAGYNEGSVKLTNYLGLFDVTQQMMTLLGDNKEAKIIDIGAGTGEVGQDLHNHGYCNLDALDASLNMLKYAEDKGIFKRLICDFLGPNKLDIPDATYDGIVCSGTFLPFHINETCFEEIIRILKPGAFFVFNVVEHILDNPWFKEFVPAIQTISDRGIWRVLSCEKRKYCRYGDSEWDMCFLYSIRKE